MKTVGKIVVSEQNTCEASNNRSPQRKSKARKHSDCSSSNGSNDDECEDDSDSKRRSDDDDVDCSEAKTLGSKKVSKQVDDQRFTIETTIKVQKCGDKKKAKKDDNEPSPTMERKKSTKKSIDLLHC